MNLQCIPATGIGIYLIWHFLRLFGDKIPLWLFWEQQVLRRCQLENSLSVAPRFLYDGKNKQMKMLLWFCTIWFVHNCGVVWAENDLRDRQMSVGQTDRQRWDRRSDRHNHNVENITDPQGAVFTVTGVMWSEPSVLWQVIVMQIMWLSEALLPDHLALNGIT